MRKILSISVHCFIECFHMTSRRPYWCPKTINRRPCWCPKPVLWELNSFLMQTLSFVSINLHRCWPREWKHSIECFHMTSRRPCWCPKPILWELNSFLMQTLSFVPINLHRCWPREWKHSIQECYILKEKFKLSIDHCFSQFFFLNWFLHKF